MESVALVAINRLSILRFPFCFQRLVTPLMCACKSGEADAAQALLSAGADRHAEVRRLSRLLGISQTSNRLGMVVVCFSSTACLFRSLLRIERAVRTYIVADCLLPVLILLYLLHVFAGSAHEHPAHTRC